MKSAELMEIKGGSIINSTLVNALARGIETLYNLGRAFGTAIRMIGEKKTCKF